MVFELGDLQNLSTDTLNEVLSFCDCTDVLNVCQTNVHFHVLLHTENNQWRYYMKEHIGKLLMSVALISPYVAVSSESDQVADTLYNVLMKRPMSNLQAIDAVVKKCDLMVHCLKLNVLSSLDIIKSYHSQNVDDEYLHVLIKLFVAETLKRLCAVDANFECITQFLHKSSSTAVQMKQKIKIAKTYVSTHSNDDENNHSVIMRLATAVCSFWDLLVSSESILIAHIQASEKLSANYRAMHKVYTQFCSANTIIKVTPKKFNLNQFIMDITQTISPPENV